MCAFPNTTKIAFKDVPSGVDNEIDSNLIQNGDENINNKGLIKSAKIFYAFIIGNFNLSKHDIFEYKTEYMSLSYIDETVVTRVNSIIKEFNELHAKLYSQNLLSEKKKSLIRYRKSVADMTEKNPRLSQILNLEGIIPEQKQDKLSNIGHRSMGVPETTEVIPNINRTSYMNINYNTINTNVNLHLNYPSSNIVNAGDHQIEINVVKKQSHDNKSRKNSAKTSEKVISKSSSDPNSITNTYVNQVIKESEEEHQIEKDNEEDEDKKHEIKQKYAVGVKRIEELDSFQYNSQLDISNVSPKKNLTNNIKRRGSQLTNSKISSQNMSSNIRIKPLMIKTQETIDLPHFEDETKHIPSIIDTNFPEKLDDIQKLQFTNEYIHFKNMQEPPSPVVQNTLLSNQNWNLSNITKPISDPAESYVINSINPLRKLTSFNPDLKLRKRNSIEYLTRKASFQFNKPSQKPKSILIKKGEMHTVLETENSKILQQIDDAEVVEVRKMKSVENRTNKMMSRSVKNLSVVKMKTTNIQLSGEEFLMTESKKSKR